MTPACQALLEETRAANVVHADETGFEQCQGTRMWLWTAVTPGAEVYLVLPGRGYAQAEALLGREFSGVIHRDRWKPYERLQQAEHQLCWSHIRRNLQGLIEVPGETAVQAAMIKLASDRAFGLWWAFEAGTLPRLQLVRRMRPIRDEIHNRLRFILTEASSTRRGLALADDLLRQDTSLWTYVRRKGVSPTNNAAERSLRPAVIWRKISYGARFPEGCRFVGSILTVLGSAKRRGLDPRVWLTTAIRAVRLGEGPPLLLPA